MTTRTEQEMREEIRELMIVDLPTGGIAVPSDKTVNLVIEVATASADARYLPVIEVLKEVDKVCVVSLLDQDALQHNMKLILPRIREALAAADRIAKE